MNHNCRTLRRMNTWNSSFIGYVSLLPVQNISSSLFLFSHMANSIKNLKMLQQVANKVSAICNKQAHI